MPLVCTGLRQGERVQAAGAETLGDAAHRHER
jgi:hypothetical protein